MTRLFSFLAERRVYGVGLALAAEVAVIAALSLAPATGEVGVPAAVTAAIAGTVAVVFGVGDGVALAIVGAVVFAALEGWNPDGLVPLVVWPGVVGAAGLFARRVEQRRALFREVVSEQEQELKRIAADLHDQMAQALAGALMMLRTAEQADDAAAAAASGHARAVIAETIGALRALAVDLSPKVLDDYGLLPAVRQLAASVSDSAGVRIRVDGGWDERVSNDAELTLYRVVQESLAGLIANRRRDLSVTVDRRAGAIVITIRHHGEDGGHRRYDPHPALTERLRQLGGRLRVIPEAAGGTRLEAELPVALHPRAGP